MVGTNAYSTRVRLFPTLPLGRSYGSAEEVAGGFGEAGLLVLLGGGSFGGELLLTRLLETCQVAGARRDQLANDDVFLQTEQPVLCAIHSGGGQDTGGLLERGRREEAL